MNEFSGQFEVSNKFGVPPAVYAATNNQVYTFIFLVVKLGCKITNDQTKWAFEEILKQGIKATEILTIVCQIKHKEQSLLRHLVELADRYEALWAVSIVADFLHLDEINLLQVAN